MIDRYSGCAFPSFAFRLGFRTYDLSTKKLDQTCKVVILDFTRVAIVHTFFLH